MKLGVTEICQATGLNKEEVTNLEKDVKKNLL